MDSNDRLRTGIAALAQFGTSLLDRRYKIEAQNEYESAATKIAGMVDRFNQDLDNDNNYRSYQEKWGKQLQELQKVVGEVKNPDAKRNIDQFMNRTMESQATVLKGKTENALRQDTYVTRTNALDNVLQQTNVPWTLKMRSIDGTVTSLYNDGIIDKIKAREMRSNLATATFGQAFIDEANKKYRELEATDGPDAALAEAEKYIHDFVGTYSIGGDVVGTTEQQKNAAQASVRDAYNITTRAAKIAEEKLFTEEDNKLYNSYSEYISSGNIRGLSFSEIDNSKLPTERKMYWRSKLEEADNLKARGKDAMLESSATNKYILAKMAAQELKRSGNALSGEVTLKYGGESFTFRDAKGLEDYWQSNLAEFTQVFGKQVITMREDLFKDIDKKNELANGISERINALVKDKKNPIPAWEAVQYNTMHDAWLKDKGGKASLEEEETWFNQTVMKPKLNRLVRQLSYGGFFPDNDDDITKRVWNVEGRGPNEFQYDVSDGRFVNPRTKDSMDSYMAAMGREYENADKVKPGEYEQYIQNTAGEGAIPYLRRVTQDGVENTTLVPFGSKQESYLLKTTIKNGKILSVKAYNPETKKWMPAQRRLDNQKVWDWTPEARTIKQKDEDIKWQKENPGAYVIDGVGLYTNPALEGGF